VFHKVEYKVSDSRVPCINHSSRFFNKFEAGQDLWWLSRGQIFYLDAVLPRPCRINQIPFLLIFIASFFHKYFFWPLCTNWYLWPWNRLITLPIAPQPLHIYGLYIYKRVVYNSNENRTEIRSHLTDKNNVWVIFIGFNCQCLNLAKKSRV